MSRTRPQQKRRGGVRDDSILNIGLNRREIAELLNVTGTAVKNTIKRIWKQSGLKDFQHSQYIKLENGYSANVYDMEVIIAIALQMDTYQALLFRQWLISKVVNRKVCQAEQVKNEYPMIIVMNGTMPRDAS